MMPSPGKPVTVPPWRFTAAFMDVQRRVEPAAALLPGLPSSARLVGLADRGDKDGYMLSLGLGDQRRLAAIPAAFGTSGSGMPADPAQIGAPGVRLRPASSPWTLISSPEGRAPIRL